MKDSLKILSVTLATTALFGLGAGTASAATTHTTGQTAGTHTHTRVADGTSFRVGLLNNTTTPLTVSGYLGSNWDEAAGNPVVGTQIAPGRESGVFLHREGGASDAVSVQSPKGSLTLLITQDHIGGESFEPANNSTLDLTMRGSDAGYMTAAISEHVVYSQVTIKTYQNSFSGLESKSLPAFSCPAGHPWLVDQKLSPGRNVPNGVQIDEPGGVGVAIPDTDGDNQQRATGWYANGASATNWDTSSHWMAIYAHCTNNPSEAYTL